MDTTLGRGAGEGVAPTIPPHTDLDFPNNRIYMF